MGALVPAAWNAEDDLLLKNAVEAGASLESLAKGAVSFSRRFTIRELQDRWYSLLYDADVSAEAASRIVEIELSASVLSKSNKSCVSKRKDCESRKRKGETIRSLYYAMKKRICNEPCNDIDFDYFLPPNGHVFTRNDVSCEEQLTLGNELVVANCVLGGPTSNGFELQQRDFEIMNRACPVVRVDGPVDASTHTYHEGHENSLLHDLSDEELMTQECLYEIAESVIPLSVDRSVENKIDGQSFENSNLHEDLPDVIGERFTSSSNCPGIQKMKQPQTLPGNNLFEANDGGGKSFPKLGSTHNNQGNDCSDFGGHQNFCSPISDRGASFHQLGYSSPLGIPIWREIEDMSAPDMQIDANLEEKGNCISAVNAKKLNSTGYDDAHSDNKLDVRVSANGLDGSTNITEGDFMDPLFNFENEDDYLYMDVVDRSCLDGLNSILLSSPNDVHDEDINSPDDPKTLEVLDTCPVIPSEKCCKELNVTADPQEMRNTEGSCDQELKVPVVFSHDIPFSEDLSCCTLNTEVLDIPDNDDIFPQPDLLRPIIPSALHHHSMESNSLIPLSNRKKYDKKTKYKLESIWVSGECGATSEQAVASLGPSSFHEAGFNHRNDGIELKNVMPVINCSISSSKHTEIAVQESTGCTVIPNELYQQAMKIEKVEHSNYEACSDSLIEKSVPGVGHAKISSQSIGEHGEGRAGPVALPKHVPLPLDVGCGEMGFPDSAINLQTSDCEEFHCESDDDVPYFSDIEAMILDMDLSPFEQDSNFSREVSRYQFKDTKKAIVRLEQGAHSYIQRAIASHGAFAVFYGRHLKYYIAKTEVLLGRATEDVFVDIDLGREGRANKVSRLQAIIKMEGDSFYLKNLGKCSISVNSKEVSSGQRFNLTPSCLIEIRSMRFIFEMRRGFMNNCFGNVAKRNGDQDRNLKFEFCA